uniref:Ankyrin and Death domain containing protein n=1 Tax=Haemonchus contortus TaxID=6289 RepID=A0A7I4YLX1_HAECO|nr:Ankyrin and Death domain containing protein [Haemonchus contortus]
MPEGVAVDERKGTLPKSLSDTEVVAPQLQKSQSARGLFIEDICATEGYAGDRLWLILANQVEDPVCLSFSLEEEGVPAEEVVQREKLFTFTVPTLPFTQDRSVQLTLRSQALHISIPFTYRTRPKSDSSSTSRFECLAEFAATGEISSLIVPFAGHIGERDGEGNTVLHISAKNSQSFALKLLLSALPSDEKEDVLNIRNTRGQTALHCAVRAGDPDSVHYLLSHGSGTRVLDNHKNSVIHYLADAYNEAIFKEILETPGSSENELDALNEEGFSALHLAVRRLKLSLIELLLEAGASINAKDSAGRSPLFHAVNMNDVEIVQFLLGKGADPNIEDDSGETPLLLCMKTANYAIMGLLIDAGADPNRKNRNGNSLSDSDDATVQRIIAGERVELPEKEVPPPVPSDLTTTRSALFGRSLPNLHGSLTAPPDVITPSPQRSSVPSRAQAPSEQQRSQHSYDRDERASVEEGGDSDDEYLDDQPSTSSGSRSRRSNRISRISQDDISCLDYLTRLRLSKLMDENSKWQQLAAELGCSHMIELISICSDDSSPTMILLDQFEQMPEAKISRVRSALHTLREEESVKLIDDRFIY